MHCVTTSNLPSPSPQDAGPSRPALFTRLHALLPQGPLPVNSPTDGTNNNSTSIPPAQTSRRQPTFLKVRIVTWNMHESLPKGDLQELLGHVPVYTSRVDQHSSSPATLPHFPNDIEHDYHLVVIAGQECPSLSGIPLGLGAGFKLSGDKDKDRDKDRDKDKDREQPNDEHDLSESPHERRPAAHKSDGDEPVPHTHGWTSILEDFFVHGMTIVGPGARARAERDRHHHHHHHHNHSHPELGHASSSTGDVRRCCNNTKGSYEMLVKERMMGLYLAVFVHRDAKHLVRGTSKSMVTAGLIGGRVGNKGAVGISLKIANTTMLFVNAHLAAHEGKVPNRLANLAKIKNELAVDDFLKADDPRTVAEDITDRFDFTFLFGDLNFRLDLSRLHADWLISRREYAQALAFDQLYNIMRNGQAFVGFREAAIDFPPTFKYDVLRTLKHRRRRSKRKQAAEDNLLSQGPPPEASEGSDAEKRHDGGLGELSSDDDTTGELASVISSGTAYSQYTSDQVSAEEEDNDSDAESDYLRRRMAYPPQTGGGLVKRFSMSAAHRAKSKLAEFLHSPSPPRLMRSRRANNPPPSPPKAKANANASRSIPTTPLLGSQFPDKTANSVHTTRTPSLRSLVRSSLSFTGDGAVDEDEEDEDGDGGDGDKGVYDSSSKQRVPSWCDRILFKSTVEPDPEPENDAQNAPQQRTAVSLLAQAWRTFRRTSTPSLRPNSLVIASPTTALASATTFPFVPSTAADSDPDATRFPPTPYVPRRKRPRPRTIDVATAATYASQLAPSTPQPSTSLSPRSDRPLVANGSAIRAMTASSALTATPDQYTRTTPHSASTAKMPASPLTSSTAGPSSAVSSSVISAGVTGPGSAGVGRGGNLRWRFPSFLSRDVEAARDADDASDDVNDSTTDDEDEDDEDKDEDAPVPAANASVNPPGTASPLATTSSSSAISSALDVAIQPPSSSPSPPPSAWPPGSSRPRKGDVVCLSYKTLDDQEMRRLEGRSDHRPVIGVYAIYV